MCTNVASKSEEKIKNEGDIRLQFDDNVCGVRANCQILERFCHCKRSLS
jgi:hypothetical protein